MKQAVLLLSHKNENGIKRRWEKIKKDCAAIADFYILTSDAHLFNKEWGSIISFSKSDLTKLEKKSILSTDMDRARIILKEILVKNSVKDYEYYWLIEYDVNYYGNWKDIINIDDDSDLIATHLSYFILQDQHMSWPWGKLSSCQKKFNGRCIRGFLPIYRISQRGIETTCREWDKGWSGHFEFIIPTILKCYGYGVTELGGSSKFTPPLRKNRFYQSYPGNLDAWLGTFRWIPHITTIFHAKKILYHPLKNFQETIKSTVYFPRMIIKLIYFYCFGKER